MFFILKLHSDLAKIPTMHLKVGEGFGGPFDISVSISGAGKALNVGAKQNFTFESEATTMGPVQGSTGGGEEVEIHGFGFQHDAKVNFGMKRCQVNELRYSFFFIFSHLLDIFYFLSTYPTLTKFSFAKKTSLTGRQRCIHPVEEPAGEPTKEPMDGPTDQLTD